MKRLKSKMFITIFVILTLSLIGFIAIFNVQGYLEKQTSIRSSLSTANGEPDAKSGAQAEKPADKAAVQPDAQTSDPPEKPSENEETTNTDSRQDDESEQGSLNEAEQTQPLDENIKFMDSTIYTVLLDDENEVKDVINRSDNDLSDAEITSIAEDILSGSPASISVENLYTQDYSYAYKAGQSLTILDNSNVRETLLRSLRNSLIIFAAAEVLVILLTLLLTCWIIKPVRESFEKQKQFIADASHELKTPLSVITASSEALEAEPTEKKWLRNIRIEADRMNQLISDLLNLAANEQTEKPQLQTGNLSKTVELAALTFEGRAFESKVRLDYDIEPDISMPMVENSIKQLVEILLDNGVKHSGEGEAIKIRLYRENKKIFLTITNRGEAIPQGEEKKIFERFYRIDKSRNRSEGRYGLGLAIAKSIVEQHGGCISASSADGLTTFCVQF